MGAHADVADDAFCLLLLHIGQEFPLHDAVELRLLVHEVDHAQVDVAGAQPLQQILKGGHHLVHVPGADILAVLPGGAEVPLDDPPLPLSGDGRADVGAHLGLRHPAVQDVDPLGLTAVDDRLDLLRAVALQPLRPQADLADHQPGVSQRPVSHKNPPPSLARSDTPILPYFSGRSRPERRLALLAGGVYNGMKRTGGNAMRILMLGNSFTFTNEMP